MEMRSTILFAMALLAGALTAGYAEDSTTKGTVMKIQLTTTAFTQGQPIPSRNTCQGEDVSPDLQWSGVPSDAKSLVLICDDPDAPAGTWVHWVMYDLTPSMTGVPEDLPKSPSLDNGAKQGVNDFKHIGYGGPCPPSGNPHRYFFKLYALDIRPPLKPGLTKSELLKIMEGHIIAQGELMGTFQRK
jgi:Raf kinase inhibitor-like YbhB/YbcL family protein